MGCTNSKDDEAFLNDLFVCNYAQLCTYQPPDRQDEVLIYKQKCPKKKWEVVLKILRKVRKAVAGFADNGSRIVVLPNIPKSLESKALILQACAKSPLFETLPLNQSIMDELVDCMEPLFVKADTDIIVRGDQKHNDKFYIVESGRCEVSPEKEPSEQDTLLSGMEGPDSPKKVCPYRAYGPGDAFGEVALLYNSNRPCTITAKTDCKLWFLKSRYYARLKRQHVQKAREEKVQLLQSCGCLRTLNRMQCNLLVDGLEDVQFEPTAVIMKAGEEADRFFIIKHGTVSVRVNENDPAMEVSSGYFGEIALYGTKRTATVTAVTTTQCMCLKREVMTSILAHPYILVRVEELRQVTVLSQLHEQSLAQMAIQCTTHEVGAGNVLCEKGEAVDCLHILEAGMCKYETSQNVVGEEHMTPGKWWGESCLSTGMPEIQTRRMVAGTDCQILTLTPAVVNSCVGNVSLVEHLAWRWSAKMASAESFSDVSYDDRLAVASKMTISTHAAGTYLVEVGGPSEKYFLILSGEVVMECHYSAGAKDAEGAKALKFHDGHFLGPVEMSKFAAKEGSLVSLRVASTTAACASISATDFHEIVNCSSEGPVLSPGSWDSNVGLRQGRFYNPPVAINKLEEVKVLGMGAFGKVTLTRYQNKTFALKVISKRNAMERGQIMRLNMERDAMVNCNSPFCVQLYAFFQDKKNVYMLMEKVMGGDLFSYLPVDLSPVPEFEVRFYAGCIVLALEHIHQRGFMHRDLKPENLMIDSKGYLKLMDFGLCSRLVEGHRSYSLCGTPDYLAPETVLGIGHNEAVDWWALGCLMFEMAKGLSPFVDDDEVRMITNITSNKVNWNHTTHFSEPLKDIVKGLLHRNPATRLGMRWGGVNDIKTHAFFYGFDWAALEDRRMIPPFIPSLKDENDCHYFSVAKGFEDPTVDSPTCRDFEDYGDIFSSW